MASFPEQVIALGLTSREWMGSFHKVTCTIQVSGHGKRNSATLHSYPEYRVKIKPWSLPGLQLLEDAGNEYQRSPSLPSRHLPWVFVNQIPLAQVHAKMRRTKEKKLLVIHLTWFSTSFSAKLWTRKQMPHLCKKKKNTEVLFLPHAFSWVKVRIWTEINIAH